jgi:hypothetical protein
MEESTSVAAEVLILGSKRIFAGLAAKFSVGAIIMSV